ncbi:nucleotidyltransferase domain-containing protein [Alkalihalobacillus pseudalcaliphilus]|uniref:nucleotidyltransferase domain-containing protein n=1 Tax=Alkalihalobacillus pseudalcaliphilus TaxID=79884 RepID=UPI00064D78C4|nr:nucleotidyltransferase domain-containing protein [Alkalihalobacillus pseudalcaliphilus]KMK76975.1 hypothetical protein AB990_05280 [Alkalihalobacillus pseudalcaliphilus]
MSDLNRGYGLDEHGFIVSDVSVEKIATEYEGCIRNTIKNLHLLFPTGLHSIYVYGSVARGDAVALKSDLDVLVIFHQPLDYTQIAQVKELGKELSSIYKSLVRDVGIAVVHYDYVINPSTYYEQAFISELCVCVDGIDIRKQFGPYKLTADIAIHFNGDIGEVYERAMKRFEQANSEERPLLIQNFSRKLIRTFYSMVMARAQIWTTKLQEQAEVFISFFGNKKEVVQILLRWVEEPTSEWEKVEHLFTNEVQWLGEHFEDEAHVTIR